MPDLGMNRSTARGTIYVEKRVAMMLIGGSDVGIARNNGGLIDRENSDSGNFVRMISQIVIM
jgi:hypothetical protein